MNAMIMLNKVKVLFYDFLKILQVEGDNNVSYAKNELSVNIKKIEYALSNVDSPNMDVNLIFNEVQNSYKSMYPPHGGLTEFFIWREDFDERVKANEPLDKIKEELRKILEI